MVFMKNMRNKLNKIKIISDENISDLEKKINSWLKKNKFIEVVQILQSETVTNLKSDSINGGINRTITICYKEAENPSLATNEAIAKEKVSEEPKPLPAITEPTKISKVSENEDDLEFLYNQLRDS